MGCNLYPSSTAHQSHTVVNPVQKFPLKSSFTNDSTAKKSLTKLTPVLPSKLDNATDNTSKLITPEQYDDQLTKQPSYFRTNRRQFNPVIQAKHDRDSTVENGDDRKQISGREREWTKVDAARCVNIMFILFQKYQTNNSQVLS